MYPLLLKSLPPSPKCAFIDDFSAPSLRAAMSRARLSYPFLVKTLVGCGVEESHHMALVSVILAVRSYCICHR
jgi:hypothetical protein